MRHILLLLLFSYYAMNAQVSVPGDTIHGPQSSLNLPHPFLLKITSFGGNSFMALDSNWLFSKEDKAEFRDPAYNDSRWDTIKTMLDARTQEKSGFNGIGWFRLHLMLDSTLDTIPLSMYIEQEGASEIYVDGKLIGSFGTLGTSEEDQERFTAKREIIFFKPVFNREMVIAIRYSNYTYAYSYYRLGMPTAGFALFLDDTRVRFARISMLTAVTGTYGMGLFAFFTTLGLVHFLLYLFYRARPSNLYYTLFSLLNSYYYIYLFLVFNADSPGTVDLLNLFAVVSIPLYFVSLLVLVYSLFYEKFPKQLWIFLGVAFICSVSFVFSARGLALVTLLAVLIGASVEVLRVIFVAIRKKKKGSAIIGTGFGFFALFFILVIGIVLINGGLYLQGDSIGEKILFVVTGLTIISIPLSMSVFLAKDFSTTNKILKKKLDEVEALSAKSLDQEKEKQRILETQKETLERQVEERTREINEKKKEIEEKNKDITDSINYAQRIQQSILPTLEEQMRLFPESFVLFMPRDIVSGDFFWFTEADGKKFAICADCTGHGVPGALMSMVGSNLLHQVIVERKIFSPEKILSEMHSEVRKALKQQSGSDSKDGMDMAVCVMDEKGLKYAGAQRPLLLVNGNEIIEVKGDKNSIGGSYAQDNLTFSLHEFSKEDISCFYIFSDGFPDQFGGPKGKKFKFKQLAEILFEISKMGMKDQKSLLQKKFMDWKGRLEQIDDVCVIGIRI